MKNRISKKDQVELIPDIIDQEIKFIPPDPILELDGFKVGECYWFEYRDDVNCYGKLSQIHPAVGDGGPVVTIYDEMIHQKFVCVPISSLRTTPIGKVRRKIFKDTKPKPKKKQR